MQVKWTKLPPKQGEVNTDGSVCGNSKIAFRIGQKIPFFIYLLFSLFLNLFSLFLLLFMSSIALFGTIYESYYTILVSFWLYL